MGYILAWQNIVSTQHLSKVGILEINSEEFGSLLLFVSPVKFAYYMPKYISKTLGHHDSCTNLDFTR